VQKEFPPAWSVGTPIRAVSAGRVYRQYDIGDLDVAHAHTDTQEPTRRDFLYIATGAVTAVGAAATLWPFIDQMNPDASVQALASIEVDITSVEVGQSLTVMWRGKPVFIRHRTEAEIDEANAVPIDDLPDPIARNANLPADAEATDANRVFANGEAEPRLEWLLMVGVCTHLGCVPLGEQGDYDGWFCPCHGSHYDTAGRIRKGPAPRNLDVPEYEFVSDTLIRVG
jgi:ubiquinol-cytochrome c reductase iron-sulfur subunit